MASLHYLTVQDLIWINSQVTKATQSFHFAKLEEGANYQYGYGTSTDLLGQARRFLDGFQENAPFAKGNRATALVGVLAFLSMNGHGLDVKDSDALAWMKQAEDGDFGKAGGSHGEHHDLVPDVRGIIGGIIGAMPNSLRTLAEA